MANSTTGLARDNVTALMPNEISKEIIKEVTQKSACLSLMKKLPNISKGVFQIPVLDVLPTAYFVTETGEGVPDKKEATAAAWTNKFLYAEEIACIVPIPQAFLDDSSYDIWAEIKPAIEEAFGRVIDQAILYGGLSPYTKPANWPDGIVKGATTASHTVTLGTGTDLYEDILGENGIVSLIEADGYFATGYIADVLMRAKLRGLRDSEGSLIFTSSMQEATTYSLDGQTLLFPLNGGVDATKSLLIAGDWSKAVYAMRQDMTYKILTEGVIQDTTTGDILYNLAQQDMVALRCTMRLGWQLPNPVNAINPTGTRYPFAVLVP